MDKAIITIAGLITIIGIYWLFFGKKEKAVAADKKLDILVDGGYQPRVISVKQGETVTLTLLRKDTNPCLEEIIFPDYKIKEYLPLGKPVTIVLKPPHPKTSEFHCGMNMFHGRIEVIQ